MVRFGLNSVDPVSQSVSPATMLKIWNMKKDAAAEGSPSPSALLICPALRMEADLGNSHEKAENQRRPDPCPKR